MVLHQIFLYCAIINFTQWLRLIHRQYKKMSVNTDRWPLRVPVPPQPPTPPPAIHDTELPLLDGRSADPVNPTHCYSFGLWHCHASSLPLPDLWVWWRESRRCRARIWPPRGLVTMITRAAARINSWRGGVHDLRSDNQSIAEDDSVDKNEPYCCYSPSPPPAPLFLSPQHTLGYSAVFSLSRPPPPFIHAETFPCHTSVNKSER